MRPQQMRDVDPMLIQCWASVADAGPTLNHHRSDVSCSGMRRVRTGPTWIQRRATFSVFIPTERVRSLRGPSLTNTSSARLGTPPFVVSADDWH